MSIIQNPVNEAYNIVIECYNFYAKVITPYQMRLYLNEWLAVLSKNRAYTRSFQQKTWDGYCRFYNLRDSTIKIGLVPHLMSIVKMKANYYEIKVSFQVVDKRTLPILDQDVITPTMLDGVTLRPSQVEALKSIYSKHALLGRGIINAFTGAGKSEILCALTKVITTTILVVAPDVMLATELHERLKKRGIQSLLYRGGDTDLGTHRITVTNIQILQSRFKQHGIFDKTRKKEFLALREGTSIYKYIHSVGAILLDEIQFSSSDSYLSLLEESKNATIRYGVSATPFKVDEEIDIKLMTECGCICIRIGADKLLAEGAISEPTYFFETDIEYPDQLEKEGTETLYAKWYRLGIVENTSRNDRIVERCVKFASEGLKTIVFVTQIAHGEVLLKALEERHQKVRFIKGLDKLAERHLDKEGFETGLYDILIVTKVFDAGIDIHGGTNVIILAGGGKSKVSLVQRTGRGSRLQHDGFNKVFVIDFKDKGEYIEDHAELRYKYLKYFRFPIKNDESCIDEFIASKKAYAEGANHEN